MTYATKENFNNKARSNSCSNTEKNARYTKALQHK